MAPIDAQHEVEGVGVEIEQRLLLVDVGVAAEANLAEARAGGAVLARLRRRVRLSCMR